MAVGPLRCVVAVVPYGAAVGTVGGFHGAAPPPPRGNRPYAQAAMIPQTVHLGSVPLLLR